MTDTRINNEPEDPVPAQLVHLDLAFLNLVGLFIKAAFAAIPALFMLWMFFMALSFGIFVLFGGALAALVGVS
tara:strand:- start:265 stop:483 length:219 start_codon:yes stop_codon:yes gene_type:complete